MGIRVKICGLTSLEEALLAAEAGADLLGFDLRPRSPRRLTVREVKGIVAELRRRLVPPPLLVGVFADEGPDRIRLILEDAGLDLAQLAGSEPPFELKQLGGRAFKVIRPDGPEAALAAVGVYAPYVPREPDRPAFLVEPHVPWGWGEEAAPRLSLDGARFAAAGMRILLGGLSPETVAAAVAAFRPWGVDAVEGVEREVGVKDPERLRAFIAAARRASGV